jgi:uncharacterized protein with GYD domain
LALIQEDKMVLLVLAIGIFAAQGAAGGRLEAFYLAFGEHDCVLLADLPDNASATAFSLTVSKSSRRQIERLRRKSASGLRASS